MKNLLRVILLISISQMALGQAANIPVCNGTNGPNCTDYFGVPNWATSPLPAGTITGYTLISGGSNYAAPTVTVMDITGVVLTGAAAPTPIVMGGVITGFAGGTGGTGYTAPMVMISDPTGSGAMATATIGPPFTGGMRKFQDALPALPFGIPDVVTFPGSDYYVIELSQYQQKMHADLPPTTLRGYRQANNGTDAATGQNTIAPPAQSYLGPVIVAQKNRPVRVLFKNLLPTGTGGNLFIPVDTTYMGAGAPYSQNRATLHLHGGATPWISDGTPHQWTAPAGESGAARGDSTAFVPDMWFDASGNVIAACAGLGTCATPGATNDPGAGAMTFYWTNQQGGRLMFYHDHAYGLTRLNVYAGEAAGYLLYDPAEESALLNATVPGTIATNAGQAAPDVSHLIPLVIQDKTFVPSKPQVDAQDPTWDGNFGATSLSLASNGNGDLWFPHVYMPNQNPNDPVGGASGFGHWDYGPWFFPPQTSLTAGPITTACTSSAFPGQTLAPSASCPSCGCPITPNPSGTPEAFMDTPVVNGVAYPVLHVAPAAYRFQILSAGNDRSWNLSWFLADSTQSNTEVAMLPAVPPGGGSPLPLCTAVNPVAVPGLVLGLDTALLDNNGNPLNGTGLPSGCWPNYGPQPGIPAPQTMWAADGRAGGAPDPRNAGPAWVQIGTEGGLLPAPVVIPPTPVNYEQNVRSITIGSVAVHGLWLGPAERADAVVDFSQYAGRTLILYNDAPTPAPANDSRMDYFTGDGDQSPIGGAPNTPAGYGPNTRTVMQVIVDANNPNSQAFSLSTLKTAFASTATTPGMFAATQPTTIVPEPIYNSAYHRTFPVTYGAIQANTLTFAPIAPQTFDQSCGTNCAVLGHKAIQELFTLDYGRMNATLGTELPNVNFTNQTTIPLAYVDPATEIIKQGETQLWKITHNGVDSHFIHFHLFNVQVINRVGWDGSIRPIDANEAGWKDTVRMNPLEDIIVALQPITPMLPFPIPNSVRLMDVTSPVGSTMMFTNVDPFTNLPATSPNANQNFGWEYVWHCHILGHEENDMMRPIIYQVPPAAPGNLVAANDLNIGGQVNLTFNDNSASETGFVIQRALDPTFLNPTIIPVGPSSKLNAANEGTDWGGVIAAIDVPPSGTYFYRAQAIDDGWANTNAQPWSAGILGSLSSGWSNVATVGTAANASVAPTLLAFGNQLVNTPGASQTVTLSNAAGAGTLAVTGISITGLNSADFSQGTNCTAALIAGSSCTITVVFTPTATFARAATLSIASSNPTPLTVSLSGTGIAPVISPSNNAFQFGSIQVGTTTTAQTLVITNTGNSPLIINGLSISGGNASDFLQTTTCIIGAGLAQNANCSVNMKFAPSAMGTRSTVLAISSSDPVTPVLNVSLSGFGTQSIAAVSPASITYPLQLVNTATAAQNVTLSNTGNVAYTINSIALTGTNINDYVLNYNCPIGGGGLSGPGTCNISVSFRPTAGGARTANVAITTSANVNPKPVVALSGTGTQVNVSTLSLTFAPQVLGTQSASQQVTLTNTGPTALGITSIALTGANPGDFTQSSTCPLGGTLGSGGSCRVTTRFNPTAVGTRIATLAISTNDPGTPVANVILTGTGIQAAVSLSPISHDFGAVTARSTSAPFVFALKNSGTAPLTINSISTGGNGTRFNQTNNCGTSLAVGASCTINVTFIPQRAGTAYTGTLSVSDNAPNSPQTSTLTGTGQ